jgi:hypothetical protein
MREAEQVATARRYIGNNPVKARLARTPEEWPWSGARAASPLNARERKEA